MIWVGAEELVPGDERNLKKYKVSIPKAAIVECIGENRDKDKIMEWMKVYSEFVLDDIPDSVRQHSRFHIKQQTLLYD